MPREDEEADGKAEQPKRERVEQVPLGIRKPKAPKFEPAEFAEDQKRHDDAEEQALLEKAEDGSLDSPEVHQDYEIRDGDEVDRHMEGVSTVNALKEFINNATEEVEEEMGVKAKPFSIARMDELMVFTREAVTGYGEAVGYAELKKRVRQLIEEDQKVAERELDRKKEAYLRSSGK